MKSTKGYLQQYIKNNHYETNRTYMFNLLKYYCDDFFQKLFNKEFISFDEIVVELSKAFDDMVGVKKFLLTNKKIKNSDLFLDFIDSLLLGFVKINTFVVSKDASVNNTVEEVLMSGNLYFSDFLKYIINYDLNIRANAKHRLLSIDLVKNEILYLTAKNDKYIQAPFTSIYMKEFVGYFS